ncbi:MAG TPA: circularly permuted type 2 ATP-grasp protein [Tepidisphaeraceae bacterium]|nr:circularly permuted type 2 ATP-grasp protein [Tepidisphaeraceae bacterium]
MTETTVQRPPGLAAQYAPRFADIDEMVEPGGSLRPHWRAFVSLMDDMGPAEVLSSWEQARRLIRENGITHNVYGAPDGMSRPWNLDLIPLLISPSEWQQISDGLTQRARLLNALLTDLYGPCECLRNGLLPLELVYANPWFLRPVHGLKPPNDQWIHLYAADLVRRADGGFRVLADRTQAPSGAGYCLENRIVLNRAIPTAFRQCNVQRLAPFFISLRKTLAGLATHSDNPRVVLLTPGPYNETYFEHAYLARYLGYVLAQGDDLTVRDGRVYLMTLSGLQRVDVILRRVDDDFCDPLELHARSFLGVPGLLEAVRERTVAVANAIGTGILQVPAFLPFLPGLCKHLLGEELKLLSADTWWCGQEKELQYVLDHLGKLVIKPAFPMSGSDPTFGDELTTAQLETLAAKIRANPTEYVAQEPLATYAAPVLIDEQLQSRRFVVRAYLTAVGDSFQVMPGGLTRVTATPDSRVVSLQKGGGSKDTWVLADGPVADVTLLPSPDTPVQLSRGGGDLASRVADDLFWLGRYTQRAESTVRLARCIFNRLTDPNMLEGPRMMEVLMRQLIGYFPQPAPSAGQLAAMVFSDSDPSGLRSSVNRAHTLAGVLRDRISFDAWQILRDIERELSEFDADEERIALVLELLNRLVAGFLGLCGMAADSMTRGQAWQFLDIGMRIERALAVTRLLTSALSQQHEDEPLLLDALLETCDSSLTYRRRYLTNVVTPAVVDLLLADETNPRSVAYQAATIERHLTSLPHETQHPRQSREHQLTMKLCAALQLADLEPLCRAVNGKRGRLELLGRETIDALARISDHLSLTYFSHALSSGRIVPAEAKAAAMEGGGAP